ncbi:MEDS domain-containing protein [Geodermatophilus ruber]|uniref:Anti-anti-sigma regulatory factor (Antagonist of anti-sigma factor) n=1 Tax=Geodermatophilus ruber TaxID=504800 RepID=A0A1I4A4Q8_9ACTN|nr:MEDS domain-containing protein [Geodermatophilus ruber]SFK51304.1 Anti-anti-sigma regulatory factor (antagonist of anti-sigma factor) [Geodermatophilus ruber]
MAAAQTGRTGPVERDPRDHLCCLHRDAAEYRLRAAAFFAEGLRAGLRVAYPATDGLEAARAELADLDDVDRLVADGAVQILPAQEVYGPGGPVDPERVVAACAAATEAALADGFRGLRMSADVTGLVRTPEQQDAFARYEFMADQYIADHPLSGLCGYSVDLGEDTAADFAALHAPGPSQDTDVRVFGCADGALGLAGEFDLATVPVLDRLLTRLRPGADAGALVVDMAAVDFLDHRLLIALDDYARTRAVALSLRSAPRLTARLLELLADAGLHLTELGR